MMRSDLTDRIMSVCAIIAAGAAVLVAAYEARLNREYQRLSVWPRIEQSDSLMNDTPYERTISNVGIGPALVRSVQISVDGKPCRTWGEVVRHLIGHPIPTTISSWMHSGRVVLAGSNIAMLKIPPGDDARSFWQESQGDRLVIRVCYSSLYNESWLSDSRREQPEPVGNCERDEEKEFRQ